jgi:hypothetical protein
MLRVQAGPRRLVHGAAQKGDAGGFALNARPSADLLFRLDYKNKLDGLGNVTATQVVVRLPLDRNVFCLRLHMESIAVGSLSAASFWFLAMMSS